MDADALAGRGAFGQQLAHERSADAGVAIGRQQGDVDDADLLRPAGNVEATGRLAVAQDDLEAGPEVVLLVVAVLGGELLPEEGGLLLVGPGDRSQLLEAGAGIDP